MRLAYADPPYPGQSAKLAGAKPEAVCRWCFEAVGADPADELTDLYPGSGAVGRAWRDWQAQLSLLSINKEGS